MRKNTMTGLIGLGLLSSTRIRARKSGMTSGAAVAGSIGSKRAKGLPERVISTHSPSSIQRAKVGKKSQNFTDKTRLGESCLHKRTGSRSAIGPRLTLSRYS